VCVCVFACECEHVPGDNLKQPPLSSISRDYFSILLHPPHPPLHFSLSLSSLALLSPLFQSETCLETLPPLFARSSLNLHCLSLYLASPFFSVSLFCLSLRSPSLSIAHTCTYVRNVCVCVCVCVCVFVCSRGRMCVHNVCIYVHTHTHTRTRTRAHTHTQYVCACVFMCLYIHSYIIHTSTLYI